MKKLIFFTLSLLFFGTSCSIEKRVHSPGYHVDWHGNGDRLHQRELEPTMTMSVKGLNHLTTASDEAISNELKNISSFNNYLKRESKGYFKELIEKTENIIVSKESKKPIEITKRAKTKKEESDSTQNDGEKYEPFAIASLIVAIFSIVFPPLAIVSLLLSYESQDRIAANPKYLGKKVAKAAEIISLVLLGILALALIILIVVGIFLLLGASGGGAVFF